MDLHAVAYRDEPQMLFMYQSEVDGMGAIPFPLWARATFVLMSSISSIGASTISSKRNRQLVPGRHFESLGHTSSTRGTLLFIIQRAWRTEPTHAVICRVSGVLNHFPLFFFGLGETSVWSSARFPSADTVFR